MNINKRNLLKDLVLPLALLEIILYAISLLMGVDEYEKLFVFQVIITILMLLVCRSISANISLIVVSSILINLGLLTHCVLAGEVHNYENGAEDYMKHIAIGISVFMVVCIILKSKNKLIRFFCSDRGCYLLAFIGLGCYIACLSSGRIFGAANWIEIGGVTIQGTEISKLIFFWILGVEAEKDNFEQHLGKLTVFYAMNLIMLIFCNELGFLILMTLVTVIVVIVCTENIGKFVDSIRRPLMIVGICLIIGILVFGLGNIFGNEYVVSVTDKVEGRILGFLYPEKYQLSYGYQSMLVTNSIFDAGLFGSGEESLMIPISTSDMIFAALIFKLGLLFGLIVVILYLMLLFEGFKISYQKNSRLAFTFVVGFAVEIIYNLAGVIGVAPIAGIPLPFLSSGGSAMVCNMIMLAIIMSSAGHKIDIKGVIHDEKQDENYHDDYDVSDDIISSNIDCKKWCDTGSVDAGGRFKKCFSRKKEEQHDSFWNNI